MGDKIEETLGNMTIVTRLHADLETRERGLREREANLDLHMKQKITELLRVAESQLATRETKLGRREDEVARREKAVAIREKELADEVARVTRALA